MVCVLSVIGCLNSVIVMTSYCIISQPSAVQSPVSTEFIDEDVLAEGACSVMATLGSRHHSSSSSSSSPSSSSSEQALQRGFPPDAPVVIYQLRKEYPGSHGNPPHIAVHSVSLAIERNECFGLLGPNGERWSGRDGDLSAPPSLHFSFLAPSLSPPYLPFSLLPSLSSFLPLFLPLFFPPSFSLSFPPSLLFPLSLLSPLPTDRCW